MEYFETYFGRQKHFIPYKLLIHDYFIRALKANKINRKKKFSKKMFYKTKLVFTGLFIELYPRKKTDLPSQF